MVADPSLQIKSGVQWGLFGSAVLQLGTAEHHEKWLPGIMDLSIPGAFAMTEIGHGSDVAAVGTTATYDAATEEFVINTPFRAATKEYLGNAALHGVAATVFAQLITNGVNHGGALLLRAAAWRGTASTSPESDARTTVSRAASTASTTAVCLSTTCASRARTCSTATVMWPRTARTPARSTAPVAASSRCSERSCRAACRSTVRHPGPPRSACTSRSPTPPSVASYDGAGRAGGPCSWTTASTSAVCCRVWRPRTRRSSRTTSSCRKFDGVFSGRTDTPADREDLETLAAALKPLSTCTPLDTLQEAREATGGAGFMFENRLVGLRADLDIYVTFEGDNNVLLQLVGKRLLTDYAKQFQGRMPRRSPSSRSG